MDGIIVVNKPKNMTSRDVVNIVSKKLKTKKIGHTGTLDPLATGVLVLCVGESTKLTDLLTAEDKEYIAEVTLGIETDTLDITGNILKENKKNLRKNQIEEVINEMIGEYDQEVPIYSAIKVNGKKLYEYARNNEKITLPKRKVKIKELKLMDNIKYESDRIIFNLFCHVSKGTYIRSLVRDLAYKLDTLGVMSNLKRIKQGKFDINNSYTLEQIENNDFKIITKEEVLSDFEHIKVDENLEFKIKNGAILPNIYNKEMMVFINRNNKVLAIYKASDQILKVYKMFK